MRWFPLLLACLLSSPGAHAAREPVHKLSCPARAPAAWRQGGVLSGVDILSAPRGERIDDKAPPSLVPDHQAQSGNVLRQTWIMNADGPGWAYYVDCHYTHSSRILRLDAGGTTRCERRLEAARPDGPQTLTCD